MNISARSAILSLCSAVLLLSCSQNEKGHATPEAAAELADISVYLPEISIDEILEMPDAGEIDELMKEFARTADAKLASRPSGITLLHLACLFKKAELARCLLIDHADPNARTAMGDTPLSLAIAMLGIEDESVTDDTIIQLIDTLVAGGADLSRTTANDTLLINHAGLNSYSEKVFLHLLNLNCPIDETTCQAPAIMGWNKALKLMLERGAGNSPNAKETMLLMAAANLHTETVRILIEAGVDVNANHLSGTTPLLEAAGHLLSPAEEEEAERQEAIIDICALLIQNGADPHLAEIRQDGSPAFTTAELLTKNQVVVKKLEARGVQISTPEINFSSGPELLEQIGKASVLGRVPSAEQFDTIALVFKQNEQMINQPQYADILPMAAELLQDIDPARLSQLIAAMPIWTSLENWNKGHGNSLLHALSTCESIILPKEIITTTAERLDKENDVDNAASLIELLYRSPGAESDIEKYIQHTSKALQAGALAAKLRQRGLPTPRDGDVDAWLSSKQKSASNPAIEKALLLTSLSRLWFGDMLPEEQQLMIQAMKEIGASEAAARYQEIVHAMDDPEKLDQITEDSDSWKFELEIATARFILHHAEAFLELSTQNTD